MSSGYRYRRFLKLLQIIVSDGVTSNTKLNSHARWFDEWFSVGKIDAKTVIISEPRYFLNNNSYLIMGDSQAILFDTGSGKRNIAPIVKAITSLPVMVITSHAHSDHMGSVTQFQNYALTDLPINRRNSRNGVFVPSFLMYTDLSRRPRVPVTCWLKPDEAIDLGNRNLKVIHTPGHSPDSISLLDQQNKMLFAGDFLYEGNLIATLGGDVYDYLKSTRRLIDLTQGDESIFPAHYTTPLKTDLLNDLERALVYMTEGKAVGRRYIINSKYPVTDKIGFITTKKKISRGRFLRYMNYLPGDNQWEK